MRADCTEPKIVKNNTVDLIVTSPPYNVGKEYTGAATDDLLSIKEYEDFTARWLKNCYRWSKPTGRICINVGVDKNKSYKYPLTPRMTEIALKAGWKYHATATWDKGHLKNRTAWGSWKSASAPHVLNPCESIIIMYKEEWRKGKGENDITGDEFKDYVFGIWKFNGAHGKSIGHPAPFPRELPKRCIKLFSFVGDLVLDPFAGSGTTMIECIENQRKFIGLELEERFCQLCRERIKKETGVQLDEVIV